MILRQSRPKVVLSLTPLIDVVFILLIFFMLVSQFSTWRNIELMSQAETAGGVSDETATALQLNDDGSFELDGVVIEGLGDVVTALPVTKREGALILSAESAVQMQRVIDVIETLSDVGIADVKLFEPSDRSGR